MVILACEHLDEAFVGLEVFELCMYSEAGESSSHKHSPNRFKIE